MHSIIEVKIAKYQQCLILLFTFIHWLTLVDLIFKHILGPQNSNAWLFEYVIIGLTFTL